MTRRYAVSAAESSIAAITPELEKFPWNHEGRLSRTLVADGRLRDGREILRRALRPASDGLEPD